MELTPALTWYNKGNHSDDGNSIDDGGPSSTFLSPTRDIFRERLRKFRIELEKRKIDQSSIALIVAICGEIGNNAFDHNLGKWQDQPGCWFQYEMSDDYVSAILADRGQGFLNSLQPIYHEVKTCDQALTFAFEKRASGRAPERRGNGLKFVKSQIESREGSSLIAFSMGASYKIGTQIQFEKSPQNSQGVLVFLKWKL